jgi:hypothetical protein
MIESRTPNVYDDDDDDEKSALSPSLLPSPPRGIPNVKHEDPTFSGLLVAMLIVGRNDRASTFEVLCVPATWYKSATTSNISTVMIKLDKDNERRNGYIRRGFRRRRRSSLRVVADDVCVTEVVNIIIIVGLMN